MTAYTLPMEQDTRILIDRSLENLGWKLTGDDRNIYLEQPRTEHERRKLEGKRPDYVLYSNEAGNNPLIIIEAKRKGSRLDSALEQGINYARILGAPLVFATDGVFCRSFHTTANKPPILNGSEIDELIREALALRYLHTHEVNTVSPAVMYSRRELIKIFDEANNMLRGEGLRAGIERFGEFANILFLKLIDESERIKRESGIHTDFDSACSWDAIRSIKPSVRIDYINKTVYDLLNDLYKTEIFTPLQIRNIDILEDIMAKLDPLTLTDIDSDVKGDAFEYFLKSTTSTQNDLGEYFTPRHIVKTMVRLVNPRIGEKIYDPFCGTGGFLIEAFRHIYNNMPQNDTTLEMLTQSTIYGNEITNTARITKMNMILAGDGHSNIHMKDSLAEPVDGKYDVVITNMPYSQQTKHGANYDIPSRNGDSICVQHCIKAVNSASKDGRIAIVVPEGFLFRKDLARVREYLLSKCQLQSIISLPQGVFLPYTGVKTDIIYAVKVNQNRRTSEDKKYFWYFDVKNDGYTLNNQRRKLDTPSDLAKFEEFRRLDEEQYDDMLLAGFEVVPFEKVKKNGFVLVGKMYRQKQAVHSGYDAAKALEEIALFGPSKDEVKHLAGDTAVSFVPMSDINTFNASFEAKEERRLEEVMQGFSYFRDDDILLAKLTQCFENGKAGIARKLKNGIGFGSTEFFVIRANQEIVYPEWIFYHINTHEFIEGGKNYVTGTGQQRINIDYVKQYRIPVPPLEVQRSIIAELEGYQNIISGAKKILASYIPHIPYYKGQDVALSSHELFEIQSGGTPSSTEARYWDGDINWITLADLPPEDYITEIKSSVRKITQDGLNKSSAKLLPVGTVCVSTRATIGRVGIARVPLATNQGFKNVIIKDTKIITPEFLALLLRNKVDEMNGLASGATFKEISKSNFETLTVSIPPMDEQKKILDAIRHEQSLIEPSRQLIKIFTSKIETRIKELWEQ